jgi:hypothetical protein
MTPEILTDPNRRFQIALERARADWSSADPDLSATLAGGTRVPGGIIVPFFGAPHLVTHPAGEVLAKPRTSRQQEDGARPAHPSVTIVLIHYLLHADGARPAGEWLAFRELPDALFYAQAFAGHAESALAEKFGRDLAGFRQASVAQGGLPLDLADAAYSFAALPRLPLAVLLWEGDDEFPGQARILFDANAGRQLPTEDLSGIGDWLAHRLVR